MRSTTPVQVGGAGGRGIGSGTGARSQTKIRQTRPATATAAAAQSHAAIRVPASSIAVRLPPPGARGALSRPRTGQMQPVGFGSPA